MIKMSINTNSQALQTTIPLTPTARQMYAILMASLFVISMVLVPWGTADAAKTAVKFHPGHYMAIINSDKDNPNYIARVHSELKKTPALRGVVVRYRWEELESKKGDYDFRSMDKLLAGLAKQKKRLIVIVQTKTFKPKDALVPNYLKAKQYDGGIFPFHDHGDSKSKIKGHNVKLWNNQVRDRLGKLINAMGQHYNAHPYFEGIGLQETAMGQPIKAISSNQRKLYYDNLVKINKQIRSSFPNTMSTQLINHPRSIVKSMVTQLKGTGTTIGVPDVWLDEKGLSFDGRENKGIYTYYPGLAGKTPLLVQVERRNYLNSRRDGKGFKPSLQKINDFAKKDLKTNYLVWTRNSESIKKVLEFLNFRGQTRDPAGGLSKKCPSVYPSCKTN